MSFTSYQSTGAVLKQFQIVYNESNYIVEAEMPVNDYFRVELQMTIGEGVVDNSDVAICENLIYPVLKEVWKLYRDRFILWSHEFLHCDEGLEGVIDYILARRSPLGKIVFDKPYFVGVQVRRDRNFDASWGHCLAAMVGLQKLNQEPDQTVFGLVSNGEIWQFGQLGKDSFTKNSTFYTIQELDRLLTAVNFVFQQCDLQLLQ